MAIGDTVTFRILGRAIDAQVANYRTVDWGGFGGNFAVIFAPGTLEAANPDYSAILRVPETVQPALTEAARDAIPGALFIDVRARLADAAGVVRRAISAVSLVSTVVIAAGALVMFGAFAAAARRRESESALLKTLGLGPAAVLALYAGEFAVTGAIAAALALGVAAAGSYPIIVEVFEARWAPDWRLALSAAGLAVVFAAAGGLVAGALSLRAPAMRALRQG
jgi:putative ABC transport system permease protein